MTAPYPAPGSVAGRVLGALLRSEPMTGKACWLLFGSSRLAHHIWFLRENGWPIHSQRVEVATSDHDRKAHIAEYWIEPADIVATGKQGWEFAEATRYVEMARKAA